jgi:hypothetical protein
VRQTFFTNKEGTHTDFGLRNYGPGAALYLQVIVTDENGKVICSIKPRERPLHLPEGGSLGFVYDERLSGNNSRRYLDESDEKFDQGDMIYLHYSYISDMGIREPRILNGKFKRPDECKLKKLKDLDGHPRRMELSTIQDECGFH